MLRLGSLCTGYGGLDIAAGMVLGQLDHVWHAEVDPHASTVLDHHWPGVTNLGDLTAVDWSQVEPVDVLTAGFPCQPVSAAGRREGINDERWLFDDICTAVGHLDPRPQLLLFENVPGLLTANGGHAMARVVQGLAALGYVGRYRVVSAASVGAAHRRERVFIVAWPANTQGPGLEAGWQGRLGGRAAADTEGLGHGHTRPSSGRGIPAAAVAGGAGTNGLTLLPTPRATRGGSATETVQLLPTPNAALGRGTGTPSATTASDRYAQGKRFLDDAVALLPTPRATDGTKGGPNQRGSSGDLMLPSAVQPAQWGNYAPAIRRWEQVTERPAPEPTEPGTKGQPRLSPRFVEWLMGLPAGWVTTTCRVTPPSDASATASYRSKPRTRTPNCSRGCPGGSAAACPSATWPACTAACGLLPSPPSWMAPCDRRHGPPRHRLDRRTRPRCRHVDRHRTPPDRSSPMTTAADIAERFAADTANHQMTVLHNDGLYRHLRFRRPGSSLYWFDLITVPGALIFQGDGDSFVFRRIEDMFEFFRANGNDHGINPSYWAEKLTDGRDRAAGFDEQLFEKRVKEAFVDAARNGGVPAGTGQALRWDVLDPQPHSSDYAHTLLNAFEHKGFRFHDSWEWSFEGWNWWYLWACHAIVWGIAQYDAAQAKPAALAEATR